MSNLTRHTHEEHITNDLILFMDRLGIENIEDTDKQTGWGWSSDWYGVVKYYHSSYSIFEMQADWLDWNFEKQKALILGFMKLLKEVEKDETN